TCDLTAATSPKKWPTPSAENRIKPHRSPQPVRLRPLTTHHSPLTTHHSPLTTHYSLLTTHPPYPFSSRCSHICAFRTIRFTSVAETPRIDAVSSNVQPRK